MTDIVERLRKFTGGYDYWELNNTEGFDLTNEAAGEIERLRAKIEELEQRIDYLEDHYEDR